MTTGVTTGPPVIDPLLRERVAQLQLAYIHTIDDGPLENWPHFFTEKCLYLIQARDNADRGQELGVMRFVTRDMLVDRASATMNAAVFAPRTIRHVPSGPLIDGHVSGEIRARTNVAIYQTSPDGDTLLLAAAQYRDIIVEEGEALKFKEKRVVYDTFRLPDSIVYPL